jgi:hypothetical protein
MNEGNGYVACWVVGSFVKISLVGSIGAFPSLDHRHIHTLVHDS